MSILNKKYKVKKLHMEYAIYINNKYKIKNLCISFIFNKENSFMIDLQANF